MRLQLLGCLLLVTSTQPLHAQPIRGLVIFGDSHSDIGNGCTLFVPADTDCVGLRYSNGPQWVEELAWRLKVPQPVASTLGGLNFAFGGARTGVGSDTFPGYQPSVPRVGTQVSRYLQQHAPRGDQLFVVLAGHNDWNWNQSALPSTVVNNMATHISTLAQAGATQFLISNLSPLGHAPYLRGTSRGAATNRAIEQYNDLLAAELDKLRSELAATINLVDLESLGNQAISDPASLGLSNILNPANGAGVTDPDEYLYWDYIHFTTAFHRLLGARAALEMGSAYDADFSGDGRIDAADLDIWTAGFGAASGATGGQGDSDGDEDVDGSDFLVWQRQHGLADPSVAAVMFVPETGSLVLLMLSLPVAIGRRCHRPQNCTSQRTGNATRFQYGIFGLLICWVISLTCASRALAQFGACQLLTEVNAVNRGDFSPSLSPDGLELYFMGYLRNRGYGDSDIWVARRSSPSQPFNVPVNLGKTVNSHHAESNPEISGDGLTLYFDSDRSGGYGDRDLWKTTRASLAAPWTTPVNLGAGVNTRGWEGRPTVTADGLELVFDRRHERNLNTLQRVSRTTVDEAFGGRADLGIASADADFSPDRLALMFPGLYEGQIDLFQARRRSVAEDFGPPERVADPVNSLGFTEVDPGYSWDGRELYFVRTSLDVSNDSAFLGQAEICLATRIPEPSSLGLCGLAAAMLGRRRCRRALGGPPPAR